MRFAVATLVIVQLLVRGVAVTHCHVHSGVSVPDDHANRPHVHLNGHSHSHGAGHVYAKHEHPHRHSDPHRHNKALVPPAPADSSPLSSDHDQDAVYLGGETLTASIVRVQVPEPIESRCFETVMDEGNLSILSRQTTSRAAGPPGANPGLPHDRLPHLLRI